MKHLGEYKRIISLLLITFIILGSIYPFNAKASLDDINKSEFILYDDDNNMCVKLLMVNGAITLDLWGDHKATTKYRWETKALTITKEYVTGHKTFKAYGKTFTGPGDVTDFDYAYLPYKQASKVEEKSGDEVHTTIYFSVEQVEKAFADAKFDKLKKGDTIRVHGVFDTYYTPDNGKTKDIIDGYNEGIKNWYTIETALTWGPDTLDDFEKYYNMPIGFMPRPYENTLYYKDDKGNKLKNEKPLGLVYPEEYVEWKKEPATITKDGKVFTVNESYVTYEKEKNDIIHEPHVLGQKGYNNVDDIRSGSTKVQIGGVNVVLVYKPKATPTPTPPISNLPTPTPEPPEPSVTPIITPVPEQIQKDIATPEPYGVIGADDRGAEKFTAVQGVPTTESLYTEAGSNMYLMGYDLEKKVGIENYPVRATRLYHLSWTGKDAKGKAITMSDTVSVTQYVNIRRAYGYWEINNFDYYKIHKADINNYSLPNGISTMYANSSYYNIPSVITNHSDKMDDHNLKNDKIINGVDLPSKSISGGSSRPSIPMEDFTREADALIPDVNVKNDLIMIDGKKIMDDTVVVKEGVHVLGPDLSDIWEKGLERCNNNVLYKPNQIIEAKKKNGVYYSNGLFTYIRSNSVNSKYTDSIEKEIPDINNVVIHTPVLCDPIVSEDNDKYVQLINPSPATQVVLDPDSKLNDFTLRISNYGHHSYKQGYYTRDFSRSLRDPENVSYIAEKDGKLRNEVKFPFDVYIKKSPEDKFIKKDTWVIMGRDTETFYVPMWVQEGIYTVSCRTIAVNADMDKLDEISEEFVNSKLENYVATNKFNVEVSGRLYGLSIYDLTDYPMWKEAFRVKNSLKYKINDRDKYPDGTIRTGYNKNYSYNYTVGTNDQYGNDTRRNIKYTFPLVNGSHPFYKNIGILKTGYVVRFKLNTTGTMYGNGCKVRMKPNFYYVDANGNNRTKVDIYYEEEINGENRTMVKMGNKLDLLNQKSMEAGSPNVGIPKQEMKDTALVSNMKYTDFLYGRDNLFSFTGINIVSTFRTFINNIYTKKIVNSSDYDKVKDTGVTSSVLMKQMQSWYGCYYLPGIMHAVDPADVPNGWTVYQYAARKGVTYHENWWKRNGYIIVNFDVVTVDSQGNEHLSYINADNYLNNNNCSMWTFEGAPLSKTDNKGVTFHFRAGDFIIYYVDKSIHSDYRPDGVY